MKHLLTALATPKPSHRNHYLSLYKHSFVVKETTTSCVPILTSHFQWHLSQGGEQHSQRLHEVKICATLL